VPRNSDVCERVCNLLLLLELLRARQSGLKLGGRGSLLSLVGGRRRARPRSAEQSFNQGLATFKGKKPTDPLDVVIAGLDLVAEQGSGPDDFDVDTQILEGADFRIQQGSRVPATTVRQIQERLRQVPLAVPQTVAPLPADRDAQKRILPERTRELVCATAALPLLRAAISLPHPLLKAAAIAGIYGCGFELAD